MVSPVRVLYKEEDYSGVYKTDVRIPFVTRSLVKTLGLCTTPVDMISVSCNETSDGSFSFEYIRN